MFCNYKNDIYIGFVIFERLTQTQNMLIQILKAKIKSLIVSESNAEYPGSISLPEALLRASGIKQFEMVHVNNKTNGNRIVTYAVPGKQDGFVSINGAASKLFNKGDEVHVLAFCSIEDGEADKHIPTLVITDQNNALITAGPYHLNK